MCDREAHVAIVLEVLGVRSAAEVITYRYIHVERVEVLATCLKPSPPSTAPRLPPRHRQTDRQTDTHTHIHTHIHTDTDTHTHTHTHTHMHM